jgi:NADPH-dependent glutamate synthase beta subunit-like oxidoreductase
MGLFKEVKKPVIKSSAGAGGEISPYRPRYVEKAPPCGHGCLAGADVRGWVTTIAQAEAYGRTNSQALEQAWGIITDKNPFPATCGRVCPHPCEAACNRNEKEGPVAINALERYVGDFAISEKLKLKKVTETKFPERVAVVGAGPAGLSCAYQLARRGYAVTVFEAFTKPGGMLRYGIPQYRLPREVLDAEIQNILDLGVELRCSTSIGKDIPMEKLREDYKAIFVGIGAHKGLKLRVPGEDAPNVFTGTEFLNRANSGEPVEVGDQVYVIGGGDTAIDAARLSRRLGAEVTLLYRRTRAEMPAIAPEIEGALEEGVKLEILAAPVEIIQEGGKAVAMKCIRMELGEPDKSGRPRPVPKPGSEYTVACTAVIAAISQEPDFVGFDSLHEGRDWIKVDSSATTNVPGVFAGGDNVELSLVGTAIQQGAYAASAIDAQLRGRTLEKPVELPVIKADKMKLGYYKEQPRNERKHVPVERRGRDTEVEMGLSREEALEETKRCMSCGLCMDCESCWMYCTPSCFAKLPKGEHYKIKLELCNGCKKCAEECPCGYIEMV